MDDDEPLGVTKTFDVKTMVTKVTFVTEEHITLRLMTEFNSEVRDVIYKAFGIPECDRLSRTRIDFEPENIKLETNFNIGFLKRTQEVGLTELYSSNLSRSGQYLAIPMKLRMRRRADSIVGKCVSAPKAFVATYVGDNECGFADPDWNLDTLMDRNSVYRDLIVYALKSKGAELVPRT